MELYDLQVMLRSPRRVTRHTARHRPNTGSHVPLSSKNAAKLSAAKMTVVKVGKIFFVGRRSCAFDAGAYVDIDLLHQA